MSDVLPITCGHCSRATAAVVVFQTTHVRWLLCPSCTLGSVALFDSMSSHPRAVFPGPLPGQQVADLPVDVASAWQEARSAFSVNAFTCAEIMCRKILMHVAVDAAKSAPNKKFIEYLDDLDRAGFIASGLRPAVARIKDRGNVAAHDLPASTDADAVLTLRITEHLLQSIYELPGLMP